MIAGAEGVGGYIAAAGHSSDLSVCIRSFGLLKAHHPPWGNLQKSVLVPVPRCSSQELRSARARAQRASVADASVAECDRHVSRLDMGSQSAPRSPLDRPWLKPRIVAHNLAWREAFDGKDKWRTFMASSAAY